MSSYCCGGGSGGGGGGSDSGGSKRFGIPRRIFRGRSRGLFSGVPVLLLVPKEAYDVVSELALFGPLFFHPFALSSNRSKLISFRLDLLFLL